MALFRTFPRKRTLLLLSVPVAFAVLFLASWSFIRSDTFKSLIAEMASDLTGASVEISQDFRIRSVFPRLKVALPDARGRALDQSYGYDRFRIKGLQISLSPRAVFSQLERGRVTLAIDNLAVITSSDASASETGSTVEGLDTLIRDYLVQLAELEVTVGVSRIDYISRDEMANSEHFRFDNLLAGLSRESLKVVAVHKDDLAGDSMVRLKLSDIHTISDSPDQSGGLAAALLLNQADQPDGANARTLTSSLLIRDSSLLLRDIQHEGPLLRLRGDLDIDLRDRVTQVSGKLDLLRTEIASFLAEAEQDEEGATESRLFTSDTLDTTFLEDLDLDVNVYFGAVRFHNQPVFNGGVRITVKDSELRAKGERLRVLGGESELQVRLGKSEDGLSFRMKLDAERIRLDRLRFENGESTALEKGQADMIVALRGSGSSTEAIAASLDGYVTAAMSDLLIKQKYARSIDRGIVSWGSRQISRLSRGKKKKADEAGRGAQPVSDLPISCASLKLYINKGRAEFTNGAIIELPENTLISSGFVDLGSESLGVVFRSTGKKFFDWSAISMIRFMEVAGTLMDPKVSMNANELAKQGILTTSSFVLGPIPGYVYSLAESGIRKIRDQRCISRIE